MVDQSSPYNRLLQHTCAIYRPQKNTNSYYEVTADTESLVSDAVPCFCAMPNGRKNILPVGIDPAKTRLFYFKKDQDITERDIIRYNDRAYIVNSVDTAGLALHHKEAFCETLLGG